MNKIPQLFEELQCLWVLFPIDPFHCLAMVNVYVLLNIEMVFERIYTIIINKPFCYAARNSKLLLLHLIIDDREHDLVICKVFDSFACDFFEAVIQQYSIARILVN